MFSSAAPSPAELISAKAAARSAAQAAVRSIPKDSRAELSAAAAARVASLPEWISARTVGLFVSLPSEPGTDLLLAIARAAGKTTLLPRVRGPLATDLALLAVRADEDVRSFPRASFVGGGIPQPNETYTDGSMREALTPDLILVPGAAFDANGGRLGQGKGYYDAWFAAHSGVSDSAMCRVGYAFDEAIFEAGAAVPTGPDDARVHIVVTPTRTIFCER